jgi:hypothetical protein
MGPMGDNCFVVLELKKSELRQVLFYFFEIFITSGTLKIAGCIVSRTIKNSFFSLSLSLCDFITTLRTRPICFLLLSGYVLSVPRNKNKFNETALLAAFTRFWNFCQCFLSFFSKKSVFGFSEDTKAKTSFFFTLA